MKRLPAISPQVLNTVFILLIALFAAGYFLLPVRASYFARIFEWFSAWR